MAPSQVELPAAEQAAVDAVQSAELLAGQRRVRQRAEQLERIVAVPDLASIHAASCGSGGKITQRRGDAPGQVVPVPPAQATLSRNTNHTFCHPFVNLIHQLPCQRRSSWT